MNVDRPKNQTTHFEKSWTPLSFSSQDTHTARSTKGEVKEYYVSEYHNHYIIQVSYIKCHVLLFSLTITK